MSHARVYTSFDLDHDKDLHDRLIAESRVHGSGFEVVARSQAGEPDEAWEERVRRRIRQVDQVIVICGEHTDVSPRVSAELRIAREQQKPYFLLWGRPEIPCTKPAGAKSADGMYSWTPDTLREHIRSTLRSAHSLAAAARYKRHS